LILSSNAKAKAGEKSPIEKLLAKIKEINGVSSVEDDSDEKDPYRQAYLIRFGKSVKGKSRDKTIKQVDRCFRTTQRMDVKVTDRALDAKMDLVDVKLRPATVPQLLTEWIEYRKGLEVRATKHWIKNLDVEIRELEVLRLAIAKLDLLFKLIKDETLTDEEVLKQVRAGLNVNEDEARWVMNRNLWQLRRMTDKGLKAKIDELNEYRSTLVERNKRPAKYILKDLDRLVKELT
jgi:DNA gyrase/topoisomerase IV subunit A